MQSSGGWYKVTTNTDYTVTIATTATISSHLTLDFTYTVTGQNCSVTVSVANSVSTVGNVGITHN